MTAVCSRRQVNSRELSFGKLIVASSLQWSRRVRQHEQTGT